MIGNGVNKSKYHPPTDLVASLILIFFGVVLCPQPLPPPNFKRSDGRTTKHSYIICTCKHIDITDITVASIICPNLEMPAADQALPIDLLNVVPNLT